MAQVMAYVEDVDSGPCDPLYSKISCLVGCLRCAEVYGRKFYSMEKCCVACRDTGAVMIDDGPEVCSSRFLTGNGLQKRSSPLKRLFETRSPAQRFIGTNGASELWRQEAVDLE